MPSCQNRPEVAVDGALGREFPGQHAPGAAGAQQVQQPVQHLAKRSRPPSATALGRRQQRLDQREFLVRHIGCVATARAAILVASGSSPHRS